VNVSPRQFKEGDIVEVVSRALSASDFPGAQLQLEVTEGLLMDATTSSLQTIERLASLGVRVAVDDFGIGYSSLAYLKRFRLHSLKIDRTFVREMADKVEDATIVRAVTALAHNLGLSVTAEGVETEAQRALVHGFGCDYAQGYLFAKPMAPAQIEGLLARQASHTVERAVA
jgi:EAL domain-containing protein (putative c-di-GMP-specific phosphodiesterase class I)